MKILSIADVRFLRFEDSLLLADRKLIEALARQLAEFQPHLRIIHNPTEEIDIADVIFAGTLWNQNRQSL